VGIIASQIVIALAIVTFFSIITTIQRLFLVFRKAG
jgi:Asp/Glu/hydantoin racemase